MNIRVLTYATHAEGQYLNLLKDAEKYSIDLVTLGWGEKWNGYYSKLKKIREKIKEYNVDDLIVVIDAFDTRINGGFEKLLKIWTSKFSSGIVFSKDVQLGYFPPAIENYTTNKIFGGKANAGMYMGQVGDLSDLLGKASKLETECKGDDQCAFNRLSSLFTIDVDELIFKNVRSIDQRTTIFSDYNSIFIGFPATPTPNRIRRAIIDYTPFFWKEILTIIAISSTIMVINKVCRNKNMYHKIK